MAPPERGRHEGAVLIRQAVGRCADADGYLVAGAGAGQNGRRSIARRTMCRVHRSPHTVPNFLISFHRVDDAGDMEAYAARWDRSAGAGRIHRAGESVADAGVRMPKFQYERVIAGEHFVSRSPASRSRRAARIHRWVVGRQRRRLGSWSTAARRRRAGQGADRGDAQGDDRGMKLGL